MERETRQSLEERIIRYLRSQEIVGEVTLQPSFSLLDQRIAPEEDVGILLEQIISNVHKCVACKDKYANVTLQHNQYGLFDLSHIIPDFCIG